MWAFKLTLLCLCFTAAVRGTSAVEIPSLNDIIAKGASLIEGTYSVTGSCDAQLTNEDGCTVSIEADPAGCMTLNILLRKLLGSDTASKINKFLPSAVAIESIEVNACDKSFGMTVTSDPDFEMVPNVVSLKSVEITVLFTVSPKKLDFDISGTWQLGSISFSVSASKNDDGITISGTTRPASKQFNIGEIISAVGSKLIPGNTVQTAVSAIGLNGIRLRNLALNAVFVGTGYGVRFSFKAISSALGNPVLYITMNSVKNGASSEKGITIAGTFKNLNIATLFKSLTTLDISGVPFVGKTVFNSLNMIYSNIELGDPIIEYTAKGLNELTPIIKGTQMLTNIKFTSKGSAAEVKITVSKSAVKFEILEDSGITVKTFIDELVSSFGTVSLPPKFNLQSFLALTLKGFDYDASSKVFTLDVELPNPIIFVPKAVELENATIVFNIRTGGAPKGGGRIGFDVKSNWRLANLLIPFTIGKPLGLSVFRAESRPNVVIPFGNLMTKFLVGLLPSGKLEDAVKKAGFGSFSIVNPYVAVYFASDIVVKVAGTATIGSWDKCSVEAMIGQVSGSFVMATGIVLTDVPITKIIKAMTDNKLDLSVLPGASIFDSTDVALSMSSQNVPKAQRFMQFTIPALSKVEILDGVSLLARFKFPKDCSENACRTFKRLLGANAQLVLKGRLYIASLSISATVPTTINIYRNVSITDVGLEIELGTRNAIGITGRLIIPDPALTFIGGFGISTSGVYLEMSMAGWWNQPFGVQFFAIGNLHIRASIVPDPVVLSAVEFGGQGKLGFLDNKNAKPLEVSMYCGIDRYSVMENFFQGSFSALTIQDLLAAFAYRPNLPKPLAEIGFPKGLDTSFAFKTKVLSNGITVQRGYFLQGMLKVLFFEAFADVKLSLNGIFVNLTVNPFKIANGLVEVAGRSSSMGPRIFVDIGWNPPRAFINIEGRIKVLLIRSYTNITVNEKGLSFEVSGSILNLFEAGLKITASYESIQTAEFQVKGYFKQGLFDELEEKVSNELNDYKKKADAALNKANKDISNAQKKFDDASKAVLSARKDVERQKKHFDNANRDLENKKRDLLKKKAAWNSAVSKVADARKAVADKQRYLDRVAADLRNKQRKSCPAACRKRRSADENVFVEEEQAKEFIRREPGAKRVKRGWLRVRIKNPIEVAKETVEKPREAGERIREAGERTREVAERGKEYTKCTAIMAARALCIKALQAAELAVKGAKGSLEAAKGTLRGAEAAVSESRRIMDAVAALVTAAQGTVNLAKKSLDAAKLAVKVAAEAVEKSKYTLEAAKGTMVAVKYTNRFGVKISEYATRFALYGMLRIQKLEFNVKLSVVNSGRFSGRMTARILGNSETFSFNIKLRSMSSMVKFLVDKLKGAMGVD